MTKPHELDQLAGSIWDELRSDAKKLSDGLFGGVLPDSEKLSRDEYLGRVRDNWGDQSFRQGLLQRVGPAHFMETIKAAFNLPSEAFKPSDLTPEQATPGTAPDEGPTITAGEQV